MPLIIKPEMADGNTDTTTVVAMICGLAEALRGRIPSFQQLTAVEALLCLSEGWERGQL